MTIYTKEQIEALLEANPGDIRVIDGIRLARTALALNQQLADAKIAQAMGIERAAEGRFRATVKHDGKEIGDLPWLEEFWAVRLDDLRALADPSGVEALAALREAAKAANEHWLAKLDAEAERDALAAKLAAAEARVGALEQERVAEWNRRREADGSRDAAFAACDAMRDERDALAGTLKYLRTQAKNGTLHPQVVIQNVDAALTTPAEETKG